MILVSFVYGFKHDILPGDVFSRRYYCAMRIDEDQEVEPVAHAALFPRVPADFRKMPDLVGELPLTDEVGFHRLPRFGCTGLCRHGDYAYMGSWNGIYKVGIENLECAGFFTNRMMCDLHGIWVDDEGFMTTMPGKDTVVMTGFDGRVIDHFTVGQDLSVYRDPRLMTVDWRFLSKQYRGSTGWWHFNYVQKVGDEIWLTSRNSSCFLVVNKERTKARLRTVNWGEPVLMHDGRLIDGKFYATSINGLVLVMWEDEAVLDFTDFNRDLMGQFYLISRKSEIPGEVHLVDWCRGIDVRGKRFFTNVEGRYGEATGFKVIGGEIDIERQRIENIKVVSVIRPPDEGVDYLTGFDVLCL